MHVLASSFTLDVTLVGVSSGRDAFVLGAEEGDSGGEARAGVVGLKFPDEFAPIIGLPDQVFQVHPAVLQMSLDALREEGTGSGRTPRGIGEELQAAIGPVP